MRPTHARQRNAVLRNTPPLYEHLSFSGTRQMKIPLPIDMKIFTINYVGKIIKRTKNGWIRFSNEGSTDRWHISFRLFFSMG